MSRLCRLAIVSAFHIVLACCVGQAVAYTDILDPQPSESNPIVARFKGGIITLRMLEEYAAEIHSLQRVPRIVDTVVWRDAKCRDLARNIIFTSRALEMNLHLDPAFIRSREYFINELLAYAVLRDNVVNRIDVNVDRLREFYATHKTDYFDSPTVSVRLIRTRSADKATSAMQRILAGEKFVDVERELSEASLRVRGQVLGPFPTTVSVTTIPPPREVIDAAMALEVGATTGPLFINRNYFVVRVEAKTPPYQRTFEEVVEYVETRVRQREGDILTKNLIKQLREELMVEQKDDAVESTATKSDDIIATIGAILMPYSEFTDLNGKVRGPALEASQLEPTRLRRFIVPYIFGEAARMRGYTERPEFKRTMFHCDLLRLGSRAIMATVDKISPPPTEQELRKRYEEYRASSDEKTRKIYANAQFMEVREMIWDLMNQEKRGATEVKVVEDALSEAQFTMTSAPVCSRISGLEALVAAQSKLPPNWQIRMLTTTRGENRSSTDTRDLITPMLESGRRDVWRVICIKKNADGTTAPAEMFVRGPHRMLDRSALFLECPLYVPWARLWRFDTDSLARHAIDHGMVDFITKHNGQVHINTRVEFEWNGDTPKACWVVFELRPTVEGATELLTLRYSGEKGQLVRKPIRECLPCEEQRQLMNEPF